MVSSQNKNRCGYCNNFITNQDDIHLIPVGFCSNESDSTLLVEYHHTECSHFSIKPQLNRTINCSGCNFELWPEFSCSCSRNYTSDLDSYQKAN
jgi:hypothetical protein